MTVLMNVSPTKSPLQEKLSAAIPWIILFIIIGAIALLRLRLIGMPLERDEGEYAYAGQLILDGTAPYTLAYNMKFPGAYMAYALIMALFGQTPAGIHIGLIIVNALTIVLVFMLARKFMGIPASLTAALVFGVMSASFGFLGMAGHATHFVILFTTAGWLLLTKVKSRISWWALLCAGGCFGSAILMKQHAVFFCAAAFISIIIHWRLSREGIKDLFRYGAWLGAGMALPLVAVGFWLYRAGVWDTFFFWTFNYASKYTAVIPLKVGIKNLLSVAPEVFLPCSALWCLAFMGLVVALFDRDRRRSGCLLLLFIGSLLAIIPGYYFRPHYFILTLPALALFIALPIEMAARTGNGSLLKKRILMGLAFFILAGSIFQSLYFQRKIFFKLSPNNVIRLVYGEQPFVESVEIADRLKRWTSPSDTIAVIGSEPQIYFYSHRRSATGYIYTYGLMEIQPLARTMQEQMIAEIEKNKPAWILFVDVECSWLAYEESDRMIFNWFGNFWKKSYAMEGIVELFPMQPARYFWGADIKLWKNKAPGKIMIFRRNDIPPPDYGKRASHHEELEVHKVTYSEG